MLSLPWRQVHNSSVPHEAWVAEPSLLRLCDLYSENMFWVMSWNDSKPLELWHGSRAGFLQPFGARDPVKVWKISKHLLRCRWCTGYLCYLTILRVLFQSLQNWLYIFCRPLWCCLWTPGVPRPQFENHWARRTEKAEHLAFLKTRLEKYSQHEHTHCFCMKDQSAKRLETETVFNSQAWKFPH